MSEYTNYAHIQTTTWITNRCIQFWFMFACNF